MKRTSDLDELASIHEKDHPGYFLVSWYEAALPSYELYLRIRAIVEEPLPPLLQFVLRAIDARLNSLGEISGLLGLPLGLVASAVDELERDGFVVVLRSSDHARQEPRLVITARGRQLLSDLVLRQPREDSLNLCLDALTGEYFPFRRLRTADSVKEAELHQVPVSVSRPELSDLQLTTLKRFWRENLRWGATNTQTTELIEIISIENCFVGYRSMFILQFAREGDASPLVQVYDGVDRSIRHEIALLQMDAAGQRCFRVEKKPTSVPTQMPDPATSILPVPVIDGARRKSREIPQLENKIGILEQQLQQSGQLKQSSRSATDQERADKEISDLRVQIASLQDKIAELREAAPTTDVLSMSEHRARLLDVLGSAKQRVIIVSPWLSQTAVDYELRTAIYDALGRNVEIWIGFGFGDDDHDQKRVLEKLTEMKRTRQGRHLRLQRLNESHAKVVICDDELAITTSFNWLSFRGREDWGHRVEFGLMTRDAKAISKLKERVLSLFEEGNSA